MTTYRAIASTETDPDAPITSSLMKALQNNVLAIREGDATAPKIQNAALGDGTISGAKLINGSVSSDKLMTSSTENSWVGARLAAQGATGVGVVIYAACTSGITTGTNYAGSNFTAQGGIGTLSGTWRALQNVLAGGSGFVMRVA